ncbi:MAG: hypothetical protein IJW29_02705 [Clostridia bacterium]|nr:hypothetical protein [Clostridia bacterium]
MVINIQIKNRVATYIPDDALPVCGNAGDIVKFSFDEEWQACGKKTARFIWGGNKFHEVDFAGDTCPVPAFLNTDRVLVGVFAPDEELASTKAEVPYLASIRCGGAKPDAMSVEAYVHEAKEAAETAATSAVAAEEYSASAATNAALARTGATLAREYSGRAEAALGTLESKNVEGQLENHHWRLALVENHLGLDSPMQIIEDEVNTVTIPENAKQYAKITKLECVHLMNSWSDGWYPQGVRDIRVLDADGNLVRSYTVPVASLADYGEGSDIPLDSKAYNTEHHNYISFENGRAYYHHNVYSVMPNEEYGECNKRREDDVEVEGVSWQTLIKLAEPEVIDITDQMGFDGLLELTDGAKIVFGQLIEEDGSEVTDGVVSEWNAARVYMIVESEI